MPENSQRNKRKQLVGLVTSKTGDKSIKVAFFYKRPHSRFSKEIKRKTVVHAHDPENIARLGNKVRIASSRPMSKSKRWRVIEVLQLDQV